MENVYITKIIFVEFFETNLMECFSKARAVGFARVMGHNVPLLELITDLGSGIKQLRSRRQRSETPVRAHLKSFAGFEAFSHL